MKSYIDYKNDVLIPYSEVKISFFIRDDYQLNPIQFFFLQSISKGFTAEQLAQATNLSNYVVESELLLLEEQNLLDKDDEEYTLTEVSEILLTSYDVVKRLNEEESSLYFNLLDGQLNYEDDIDFVDYCDKEIKIEPLYTKHSVNGLIIDDDLGDILYKTEIFDDWEYDVDSDDVIEAIYAELSVVEKKGLRYEFARTDKLPCAINPSRIYDSDLESENLLTGVGSYDEYLFEIRQTKSEDVNHNKFKIDNNNSKQELITCLQTMLEKIIALKELKPTYKKVFYDKVSGYVSDSHSEIHTYTKDGKRKVNVRLPEKNIDEKVVTNLVTDYIKGKISLDVANFSIFLKEKKQRQYFEVFDLEDILEDDYED